MTQWAIVPALECIQFTEDAIADLLAQTGVDCRILLINQGSSDEAREAFEALADHHHPRVLLWSHQPPLPSLSATWNRALQFVWATGATEALVANNDLHLHPRTYDILLRTLRSTDALFVSAVGVREGQFDPTVVYDACAGEPAGWLIHQRGGPDFSCFVITKAGHRAYPFDEGFVPAYCEDLDAHRRYMLGGDGARIFSVNLPYLHYASRTVNSFTPAQQQAFATKVAQSRRHYERKWGGPVNQETYAEPFSKVGVVGVTTPELQARVHAGEAALSQ